MEQLAMVIENENCRVHRIKRFKFVPECLRCGWTGRIFPFHSTAYQSFVEHYRKEHT